MFIIVHTDYFVVNTFNKDIDCDCDRMQSDILYPK